MRKTTEPHTSFRPHTERLPQSGRAASGSGNRRRHVQVAIAPAVGAVAVGGLLNVLPVQAFEFGDGDFQGSLDTTVSHGMTYRVEKRNDELAGDANGNDGNLNYDRGVVSNVSKFVADLDISQDNYGLFVRTTGFLDFENENGDRARTPLSDEAKDLVGGDIEVLDAYFTAGYNYGDTAIDVRLGKHVLNWGESTFIPNGINAINPFDVSKLRLPGSELREALLPVGMASVTVEPNDTLSVTGFYQYDWEETRIDPVGSYFSSTDYAGPGAREAVIFDVMRGLLPDQPTQWDQGFSFGPLTQALNADLVGQRPQAEFDPDFVSVLRGPDGTPEDGGQYGLAVRYFSEELNNTEFGFYFINYHSRLPTVAAQTSPVEYIQAGLAAAGAVGSPTSVTTSAVTQQVTTEVTNAAQAGLIPPASVRDVIMQRVGQSVGGIAGALAIDRYGKGGHYLLEYAEDIKLFGLSFNTVLGSSGWALQGEYSLRQNAPLQIAERVVLEDGLSPIITALGLARAAPAQLPAFLQNYRPRKVQGYVESDVSQLQATATRLYGPTLGANALVVLAEAAVMHVHDMPDVPLESPAGGTLDTADADADATSWGYRIAARLDYYNAIGAINLYPYAQFLHDVSGNSPAPSGPFVEGRTGLTLGLKADYLSRWQADFGYTRYAGKGNELSDRDFISASIKYSF
ncbi:MAG: DUF1302 domain-containing protein [Gammaproteobacteria bacterium]|nr:DUF1302 domain-containing protein [Gammaproteobacteria bacterium]MYG65194.1 DUF1302 domain-containing protein [Gammaproteobacteria bacterium]